MSNNLNLMSLFSIYAEINDMQADIIDIQKKAMDELISLLRQHVTVEELDALDAIKQINKAAAIRECVERKKLEAGCAP